MEYAQQRLDYEQNDRLSTMTAEEKRKLGERKAQKLEKLIERADAVLVGNKQLLAKRELERMSVTTVGGKENLRERKARELREVMDRADLAFEAFRASATGTCK